MNDRMSDVTIGPIEHSPSFCGLRSSDENGAIVCKCWCVDCERGWHPDAEQEAAYWRGVRDGSAQVERLHHGDGPRQWNPDYDPALVRQSAERRRDAVRGSAPLSDYIGAAPGLVSAEIRPEPDRTYEQRVESMANAIHKTCELKADARTALDARLDPWQGDYHGPGRHLGQAHDLVRRTWPELDNTK